MTPSQQIVNDLQACLKRLHDRSNARLLLDLTEWLTDDLPHAIGLLNELAREESDHEVLLQGDSVYTALRALQGIVSGADMLARLDKWLKTELFSISETLDSIQDLVTPAYPDQQRELNYEIAEAIEKVAS